MRRKLIPGSGRTLFSILFFVGLVVAIAFGNFLSVSGDVCMREVFIFPKASV